MNCLFIHLQLFLSWKYHKGTSIRQAPVFRHLRDYGKAHGSLLSGWVNYNYTCMLLVSYIQQYFNTFITVLTNQVWKLLIALFKVPNTGAFTVPQIVIQQASKQGCGSAYCRHDTEPCSLAHWTWHALFTFGKNSVWKFSLSHIDDIGWYQLSILIFYWKSDFRIRCTVRACMLMVHTSADPWWQW